MTLNDPHLWLSVFPVHREDQHKYDHGHVLIYGGAELTGAARLAAHAAMRIGAGLATILCPPEAIAFYSAPYPHLMVRPEDQFQPLAEDPRVTAFILGPGSGKGSKIRELVLAALRLKKPCVLDADALTTFSDDPQTLFSALHPACVLTPHEGEFLQLFGEMEGTKIQRAQAAARQTGSVVLLKGAETVIAAPDGKTLLNTNAPPELATAGAGDVLSGFIGGLLAQGMPAFEATCAAAWLHGAAATSFGPGLVASDLPESLPGVLKNLLKSKE